MWKFLKMEKKIKKEYIEMNVIDWDKFFLALITYPLFAIVGITTFFFNFIRYNLKLLFYLLVSIIPIINSSIVVDEVDFWNMFDEFKFTMDNLKYTKKFEVKNE